MKSFKQIKSIFIFLLMGATAVAQVSEDFESGSAIGWTTSGTGSSGTFIVGNPTQQTSTVVTQPEDDHTAAPGVNAYFTATNTSAGVNDVDGGTQITTSPIYNITATSNLSLWYFHGQRDTGDDANDFFLIEYSLNGGATYNTLVSIGDIQTTAVWQEATLNNIASGSNLVIRVSVSDGSGEGDIIEGGIDDLTIIPNPDTDGDGIQDSADIDNDNDGIPDCFEDGAEDTTIGDVFSINGDATQISPLEAQLTPEVNGQAGSITITDRVDFNDSFTLSFEANLGDRDNNGADGIAIIFHDDPAGAAAVGAPGNGLGARGIQNGIVLELDTYDNNNNGDVNNDHTMIWESDNQANALTPTVDFGNLEDGLWHPVTITWNATTNTIQYTVDGINAATLTNDLVTNFFGGNNLVFFGFSASTGGSRNDQRIRFANLCDIPLFVDDDGDGIPNYLDLDSDNDGILDVVEGGDGALDTNNDGRIDSSDTGYADTNNDGQADASVDTDETPDSDADNDPDFTDNDSDNDGCFDAIEAAGSFTAADVDVDGELTGGIDTNGIPNVVSPAGQNTTAIVTTAATTNIGTQPTAQATTTTNNATFSVAATGNGTLTYQWQQSTDGGANWTDLADGSTNPVISGATTDSITLTSVPLAYNTYQYRVVINNDNSACIDVISNEVSLSVTIGTVITNRRITYRVKPN